MHSPERLPGAGAGKIRVLLLTDEMEVGGTQRQIVHIARHLDPARFEATVLYFVNRSYLVDELEAAGIAVLQVEKRGRLDVGFVRRLRRVMQQGRFDVLHCFAFSGEFWGSFARRLLPRGDRPALISSVRGTYEWYSRRDWRIKRWVTGQSWRVVANSRIAAAYAEQQMGLADGSIAIAYNGAASAAPTSGRATALRAALGIDRQAPLALFVGRLVVHKDLPCLVRAAARLRDSQPALRILIAGDGPLEAPLREQIVALGLQERVKLLGQRDDIPDLIDASDMVVLPSLREGLSNVILEGMMGGKPVVASRAGGNVELVQDNDTGLLFDIGDDAALAAAIGQLAVEPALRRHLGEAARRRAADTFSIPAMIQHFERLYRDAAGAARR